MSPVIRNNILRLHRWTGLSVGLVAAFIAVTGLAMVFRPQIEPLAERTLRGVASCQARLPLDTLVARARPYHPDGKVYQVEVLDGGRGATIVRFADLQGIYLDSCSGAVLGERNRWGGFFGFAEWLHRLRFVGDADAAETIGGSVSALVALLLVGGGLAMWWPGNLKRLRNALKFRLRLEGRAFDVSLHRTAGAYVAAVLLLSTLTSLTFTFDWARHLVFAVSASPMPPGKPAVAPSKDALLPLEAFLSRSLEAVPNARDLMMQLPRKPGDAVEVQALERDAPHAEARTFLYLDPRTGGVVRLDSYAASSAGNKAYRFLGALHKGEAGLPLQLLLFAGIFGVPVLAFTGVRSWLRGRAGP